MSEAECGYCGRVADDGELVAASIDVLAAAISDGLSIEYEDPIIQVGYDSREGGYLMPYQDTFDLLHEHDVSDSGKLISDLTNVIETQLWCQKDPYRPSPHQALSWGWQAFRRHVMYRKRFTFLLPDAQSQEQRDYGEIPPEDMLLALARAIDATDLVKPLPAGTCLIRARVHSVSENPRTALELGAPPRERAKANRMTPAGISGFYAAMTEECALAEVRGYAVPASAIALGTFITAREVSILDLASLPALPSLFDEEMRHLRGAISFLRDFSSDVARVARPDDMEHLDYVPTQVVAEYLHERFALESEGRSPIEGIVWASSRVDEQRSLVLFVGPDACVDERDGWAADAASLVALRSGSVRSFVAVESPMDGQ
ncbi:HEPN-associated N-terminal domain-containing protein [Pseudonocardia sp. SID8383]|uniref:HEPN-associated N-terminal domain-containing protein n=1 Tax=Pseudonocardia sp. SID8383 TaxID=2690363 RepID=UPI001367DAE6|nr:HEPN-associated N-terminal domain-containing protein [Pseudonocardia sp. SID8383]MYW71920.1 RES domain-containing protein [Pseudonocardia sp. SID8383]